MNKIYLAGGCFWGIERFMSLIDGVDDAVSGYANGDIENPTYQQVVKGDTNFRETVEVTYSKINLETILFAFFRVIDPTVLNRQGNDVGSQYQTGIYYIDDESRKIVEKVVEIEKKRFSKFCVEIKPLKNFYKAEEYHQKYLVKNPTGYCHVNKAMFEYAKNIKVNSNYNLPSDDEIKNKLTDLQYNVTQYAYTERPFENEYFNFNKKGIYVDVVTGEPLFTSKDKFDSSCGWPAFSNPIDDSVVVYKNDYSHGMNRVEVLSRSGNSHLGHVFTNDFESKNGIRFCINSASLKFIPYEQMDNEYADLKYLLDE